MIENKCQSCESKDSRKGCNICRYSPYLCDNYSKKVEPKVLTAEESLKRFQPDEFRSTSDFKDGYRCGFDNGKPQGRLERDLELKPLIEAVKEYRDDYQAYESMVIRYLQNLKPLNEVNP